MAVRQLMMFAGIFTATLDWSAAWARHATDEPLLESLASIEQQAGMVVTARASFSVNYLPSTAEEKQRIQAFFRLRDQEYRAGSHFWSEHQARRQSYRATWLRKGRLEREERANVARPAVTEITVFDGEVVRTLDNTPFRACLYITPPDFQWTQQNRVQPFAFAYEFRSMAHAQIIRRSTERYVTREIREETPVTQIVVRHPLEERLMLRFTLDDRQRLLEREAILTKSSAVLTLDREQPTVYSRHEFFDHRPYQDGHGGTIWFPSKAILRYFLGTLSDGSPVQNYAVQVDIGDIEFNGEIPDARFNLVAPEGITVYDHRDDRLSSAPPSY